MAIIYSLITVLGFTISNVCFRVAATKEKNSNLISVLYNIFATIFALPIIIFFDKKIEIQNDPHAYLVIATLFGWTIFSYLVVWIGKRMEASTNALLYQMTAVFGFLLGVLWLGEGISELKILGVAMIVLGNISLYIGKTSLKIDKVFFVRMFLNLVLALTYTLDSIASPYFSRGLYIVMAYFIPGVILLFLLKDIDSKGLLRASKENFWPLIGIALPSVVGYYFLLLAYETGDISIIIPVISTNTITTVLASGLFLNERKELLKKIILAIIVFGGVVILGLL